MLKELLPLLTYCLLMSATPGPNNVMLASSGANFGYRRALPLIMGIQLGSGLLTFVTCLGLGSLFIAWPVLHQVLRLTGALYLLYLAWKLVGSAIGEVQEAKPLTMGQAALFQMVNPKTWVKAVTVASVFMPVGLSAPAGALLAALLGVLIGFQTASVWALFGVAIRRLLTDPLKRRVFNLTMGAMLVMLALMFLR
jgi:threonine/homoserine/homoserine lactone efflux protein